MLKFQPPSLNDEVCRPATDKRKQNYEQSKNRGNLFYLQFFFFYFRLKWQFPIGKEKPVISKSLSMKKVHDF